MKSLRSRFFTSPKKAFLIKLVSVLGFGGVVGFCVLGCDKQVKPEGDAVQDREPAKVDAKVEVVVQPGPLVEEVAEPVADAPKPVVDVLEPTAPEDVLEPTLDLDPEPVMAPKYGVIYPFPPSPSPEMPPLEMGTRYGAPMPKR